MFDPQIHKFTDIKELKLTLSKLVTDIHKAKLKLDDDHLKGLIDDTKYIKELERINALMKQCNITNERIIELTDKFTALKESLQELITERG